MRMSTPAACLSFETVYTNYSGATLRKIARYTKDEAIARDLLQDIFLKLWCNWSAFDDTKGTLYTWIMVVTTSTCIDYLRRNSTSRYRTQRTNAIGELLSPLHPDTFIARGELLRLARSLSLVQREVLTLIYYKGLTQEEVAHLLHIPLGTIKSRQRAAIIALRKMYRV
jgi:RNA polymerase sigma factor (sigma-70 family)